MKISVTWEMQGSVDIDAPTVEEAMEIFLDNRDTIPLPNDGEYIEGTFNLGSDDPEIQKMFTEIPDEEEPVETEAVECCPFCEGESVFPNWDVETQGYIAKCQHCGREIFLCDECLHAADNCARKCDWHEEIHGDEALGICFRGIAKRQTDHQAESVSVETSETPETSQKPAAIKGNDVTYILCRRWIACYMLYDWNPKHAAEAYDGNTYDWIRQTYKRLEGKDADANTLTDTFNQILLEDVEDFIQTHMKVWKCDDRLKVEAQVVKALAELNAME